VQHVALDRREVELLTHRRQVFPLGEEEPHEELPGTPRIGVRHPAHETNYT